MSRVYDIKLSCGCLVSLDGGGGCMPCFRDACKYEEEYFLSPKWVEWELQIFRNNWGVEMPPKEEIEKERKRLEKEFRKRKKEAKNE